MKHVNNGSPLLSKAGLHRVKIEGVELSSALDFGIIYVFVKRSHFIALHLKCLHYFFQAIRLTRKSYDGQGIESVACFLLWYSLLEYVEWSIVLY